MQVGASLIGPRRAMPAFWRAGGRRTKKDRPMKALPWLACVVLVSFALGSCNFWPEASYRYKLTISVETPEGLKTSSNVVELDFYKSWDGAPHRTYGQALVIDLGTRGALVALLTRGRSGNWVEDDPKYIVLMKCGDSRNNSDDIRMVRGLDACKAAYPVDLAELPDLLLLKKAEDPSSAVVVDPGNPQSVLGPGVVIRSATIQVTNEPLTHGVDDHLPWVRGWWGRIDSPPLLTPKRTFDHIGHIDFIAEGNG
jgi:hypothetical protein